MIVIAALISSIAIFIADARAAPILENGKSDPKQIWKWQPKHYIDLHEMPNPKTANGFRECGLDNFGTMCDKGWVFIIKLYYI